MPLCRVVTDVIRSERRPAVIRARVAPPSFRASVASRAICTSPRRDCCDRIFTPRRRGFRRGVWGGPSKTRRHDRLNADPKSFLLGVCMERSGARNDNRERRSLGMTKGSVARSHNEALGGSSLRLRNPLRLCVKTPCATNSPGAWARSDARVRFSPGDPHPARARC